MRRLGEEDGLGLVELLLGATLMLVVLGATLKVFEVFVSHSEAATRLSSAQDDARRQLDVLTREVRNASEVVRPAAGSGAHELVVRTTGGQTVRWCVAPTTRTLWRERLTGTGTAGAACPSTGDARTVLAGVVAGTDAAPLFTAAADGRSVGLDLRLRTGDGRDDRATALRTAAFLRATTGRPPVVAPQDVEVTCTTRDGRTSALLRLGAGVGGGEPLTARFTLAGVPLGTGAVTVAADAPVAIGVAVTNVLGLQTLLTRQVSC